MQMFPLCWLMSTVSLVRAFELTAGKKVTDIGLVYKVKETCKTLIIYLL